MTLGEWSAVWFKGQAHLKVSTRVRYESLMNLHVLPRFGKVAISRITHAEVVAWCSEMTGKGLAPGSVRQAHRVLSLMLGLAVRDGRLARNVCEHVPLPKARRGEPRYLTADELHRLADAAGSQGLVVLMLGYTGLRFGELTALRAGRIDLMRRRLTVEESASEVSGTLVWSDAKTHQARTVGIPRFLCDQLTTHLAGKGPNDLAFTATKGGPLRLNVWRRDYFDKALKEAGLTITPHDLRHTAASLAVSAGANVKVIQRMLGHQSAAMTLDVYAGLFSDDLDAVAERLNGLVPPACPTAEVRPLRKDGTGA